MPSAAAIANPKVAEQAMYAAQKELMNYISGKDRFTPAGIAQHNHLVDELNARIAEYMDAFKTAQAS
jgi:hypothetical protein